MNKACIFDFDGVIIDTVEAWETTKPLMYREVYGDVVANQMLGKRTIDMDGIHALATSLGSSIPIKQLFEACDKYAAKIYREAPISAGLSVAISTLLSHEYVLGIVSASPKLWIQTALARVPNARAFRTIISLQDRSDLSHKPAPDGYLEAMRLLEADPKHTIIIEDSNAGIASAKAAGAYTIALTQHNKTGYAIEHADLSMRTFADIAAFIPTFRNDDPVQGI